MNKRTKRRVVSLKHLSRDAVTRIVSSELSGVRLAFAKRHLARCEKCRERYEQAMNASRLVEEYRRNVLKRIGPLSGMRREEFLKKLDIAFAAQPVMPWWRRLPVQRLLRPFGNVTPAYTSSLFVLLCGIAVFVAWRLPLQRVSAAEVLNRAVAFDTTSLAKNPTGAILRRLRIQSGNKKFDRDLYRDLSGQHVPRHMNANPSEANLSAQLALAGVNWDDPLSAISFKAWHDRQTNARDEIARAHDGLLTIRTRVSSASIVAETLTVRQETFHPIERTIQYRDASFVSISEIAMDFVSWDKAKDAFAASESNVNVEGPARRVSPAAPAAVAPAVVLPSPAQLNEAELIALLLLSRKNADTGEEIAVTRNERGVVVGGLVQTEQRKSDLNEALRGIPYLTSTVQTFADLQPANTSTEESSQAPGTAVLRANVSPLEIFFLAQKRNREELSHASAALFETALVIQRSGQAIEQFTSRFPDTDELTPTAQDARRELLALNAKRLVENLQEEQSQLINASLITNANPSAEEKQRPKEDLTTLAKRNMSIATEMISGNNETSQSARELAAELAKTISSLRAATLSFTPSCSHHP